MRTYLCTPPSTDASLDELSTRLPMVDIHRLAPGHRADPNVLNGVDLLHTSEGLPEESEVPNLRRGADAGPAVNQFDVGSPASVEGCQGP
jgi:hypothetical protein